jgi:Flp pilus assembly protein TadG
MVEFALTILTIMFVLFWLIEFVILMHTYTVLADSAKEGVRYAIVHGSGNTASSGPSSGTASTCIASPNSVSTVVLNYAAGSFQNLTAMTTNVCYLDGNNQPGNRVQVTVSYPFLSYVNLPWTPPTIHASAEGRVVF